MAKTCTELITRIKELVGRNGNVSSSISLDDIILDALNNAQLHIVRKVPNILELQVKDTGTLACVTDQYEYSLAGFDPAIAHLSEVWIMDGTDSRRLRYRHKADFDRKYPDVSEIASGMPGWYTRRGNKIEFNCPVASNYSTYPIRVDYCKWAAEFASTTSTEVSRIQQSDKGLILFAWAETLNAIAKGNTTLIGIATQKKLLFDEWMEEFADYHDMQLEEIVEY